jgi:ABC-type multidrug transport system, ATPase and permease components
MKLIFKYLKPVFLLVILCIAMLVGQAFCDLSLPNMMSDIVNVGIQQSGVQKGAPEAISEKALEMLHLFMSDDDKKVVNNGYHQVMPNSTEAQRHAKKYPLAAKENIYVLSVKSEIELVSIERVFSKTACTIMQFMQEMEKQTGIKAGAETEISAGYSGADISMLYPILSYIEAIPAEAFENAARASEKTDETMRTQIGIMFSQMIYKELGADVEKMRTDYIYQTGAKMLLISLLAAAAAILVGAFSSQAAARASRNMRRDLFAKVEGFSSEEYDKFSTASLITRTTNDVQQVQMLITFGLRMFCYAPVMGIGGVLFAVDKSASLGWIIGVVVLVLLGIMLILLAIILPKFKLLQKLTDKLNLVSRENLSGLMVIRAFGNEGYEENRFDKANDELSRTNLFVQKMMSMVFPLIMLIMNVTMLAIIWFGAKEIEKAAMQLGDMMAFIQYAMHIIMSFMMIAMMFVFIPRALVSARRIQEVLSVKAKIRNPRVPSMIPAQAGTIKFENVAFSYPGTDERVLENISFTAKPGETTAIIGATGAGKSTLINLIPRFYDVTSGRIMLDGIDIRKFKQEDLRGHIGYVPQKGLLFSGTVESNLRYGKENATENELKTAIKTAQAADFVLESGEGLKMPITQGGGNVSGGQRQRLSIARALVRKAKIYIFDDSFSALDFKTDAALRKAMKKKTANATMIVVAQRVGTIMNAEQIIVLEDGKMVGRGTHRELLISCPAYREIAESQMQKEELE